MNCTTTRNSCAKSPVKNTKMAAQRERDLMPTISNLISLVPKLHTNIELILAASKSGSTRLPVTALFASITRPSP